MQKHLVRYARPVTVTLTLVAAAGCKGGTSSTPPGPPADIVTASAATQEVLVGGPGTDSLRARVVDDAGKGVPNVEVRWTTDNFLAAVSPSVNVTDASGFARATVTAGTRAGTAGVNAEVVTTAGPRAAAFSVRVLAGPAASLTLNPQSVLTLNPGGSRTITATAQDSYGNPLSPQSITWSSSNAAVAEVSTSGLVTAKALGTATITAALGTLRRTVDVTVADIAFADNFNQENGGRPMFGARTLANWNFLAGNVDLIGGGGEYNYFPGNGLYVDLDGVYSGAHIETKTTFNLAPGSYVLRFRMAGSQRGDTNTVLVRVGSVFSEAVTLPSSAQLTLFTRTITVAQATEARISFLQEGSDGFGLILDDVSFGRP